MSIRDKSIFWRWRENQLLGYDLDYNKDMLSPDGILNDNEIQQVERFMGCDWVLLVIKEWVHQCFRDMSSVHVC